uniref:hypothetical protein n=1 Tax=Sinomonas notoginsengisoli TaxID=1457311 RepID=UPI001F2A5B02
IEIKEGKELRKDIKDGKAEVEGKIQDIGQKLSEVVLGGGVVPGASDTEARLAALESTVQELGHFIAQSLRPDLGAGALAYDDVQAQQARSKDEKDLKDAERLG